MQANRWYTQGLKGILLCRDRCDSVEPNAIGVPDSAPRLTTAFDAVDHCYGAGRRPFRSALTSVSGRAAFWFGDSPTFRVRNRTRGGSPPCVGRTRPSLAQSPRFSPYSSVVSPLISSVASPLLSCLHSFPQLSLHSSVASTHLLDCLSTPQLLPLISSVASPLLSRLHSSPHHPPHPLVSTGTVRRWGGERWSRAGTDGRDQWETS